VTSAARARRLARLAGADGVFRVLAIDHRDSLRVVIAPDSPHAVPVGVLRELKADLARAGAGLVTGVMLDPEVGMDEEVVSAVPRDAGIIAALEEQGYLADPSVTHTTLLAGWGPATAAERGADAVKLLALWDGAPLPEQHRVISSAVRSAHAHGLPLVLEPLPRGLPPVGDWVLDWVQEHRSAGADLFKLPYPGSVEACAFVTEALPVPWVTLSAGAGFDDFLPQLESAMTGGAAGYIVGRAVWKEAATLDPRDRAHAIESFVIPRLERLAGVGA
jgi:tagatose 1,6-diphosphate aldolase